MESSYHKGDMGHALMSQVADDELEGLRVLKGPRPERKGAHHKQNRDHDRVQVRGTGLPGMAGVDEIRRPQIYIGSLQHEVSSVPNTTQVSGNVTMTRSKSSADPTGSGPQRQQTVTAKDGEDAIRTAC